VRRVFLFDVDGTLVRTGGAGIRALDRAFEGLYGVADAMRDVRPHGKTDFAICREVFARWVRGPVDDAEIARVIEAYLPFLEDEIARSGSYEVLPGVATLLSALEAKGVMLGLATGNVERGARVKIARADLNRFFRFGGFGDDSEDRVQVVRAAWDRAAALLDEPLSRDRVFVVGDTVLDVRAAHGAGCRAVAVASGWEDAASLAGSAPDYVLESLEGAWECPPFDGRSSA
jgi:phosphoglycolate phosphatase-like HAD superfamily hydrolase